MALGADHPMPLDLLDEKLESMSEPAAALFAMIIAGACTRLAALRGSAKTTRLDRLIQAGAWIDAAIALLTSNYRLGTSAD